MSGIIFLHMYNFDFPPISGELYKNVIFDIHFANFEAVLYYIVDQI